MCNAIQNLGLQRFLKVRKIIFKFTQALFSYVERTFVNRETNFDLQEAKVVFFVG